MEQSGMPQRWDEAREFIAHVEDPVTRNLLNMAFTHVVKNHFIEKADAPQGGFDMLYFVKVLQTFFAEHEVIARTLEGEKVGAWFD